MGAFEEFLNKGSNYKKGSTPEYYEDTHDRNGNYKTSNFVPNNTQYASLPDRSTWISSGNNPQMYPNQVNMGTVPHVVPTQPPFNNSNLLPNVSNITFAQPNQYTQSTTPITNLQQPQVVTNLQQSTPVGIPLPNSNSTVVPRNYQNLVIYHPSTPEDVEMLIDYLRRKEPAIINLDNVDDVRAQRVLDFVSGAIFALNGSIQRVSSNIFLLCPEGLQITTPI
ncbi:MAG: cell division protein SepF [Clostridiales bacterium]|jgi:FtsZ-interacting cell division protein YlmF|nr:cell division protein SepF [Clostridiales bacterium]